MHLVNLTTHTLVLAVPGEAGVWLPPSGVEAHVSVIPYTVRDVAGLPVPVLVRPKRCTEQVVVKGLPAPRANTVFLVPGAVLPYCQGRRDVMAPHVADTPWPDGSADSAEAGRLLMVTYLVAAPEVD